MNPTKVFLLLTTTIIVLLQACSKDKEASKTEPFTIAESYICNCEDTLYKNEQGNISVSHNKYTQYVFVTLSKASDSTFTIRYKRNLSDSSAMGELERQLRMNPEGNMITYSMPFWGYGRVGGEFWGITKDSIKHSYNDSFFRPSIGYNFQKKLWLCSQYK